MKTRVIQDEPDGSGAAALPAARAPRGRGGRTVGGIAAVTVGVTALVGGGALVGVHATQRDGDGFYGSEIHALSTPTSALVSDGLEVDADGPDWLPRDGRLGDIRVGATAAGSEPIFVGVARQSDVDAYLDGVAHEVTDFGDAGTPPGTVTPGTGTATPPASQDFWASQAGGTGAQAVVWPLEKGDWAAVVMNADGSAGVRAATSVAVKTGIVLWLGIGALVAGTVLAGAGTALVASGRRRNPTSRRAGATA